MITKLKTKDLQPGDVLALHGSRLAEVVSMALDPGDENMVHIEVSTARGAETLTWWADLVHDLARPVAPDTPDITPPALTPMEAVIGDVQALRGDLQALQRRLAELESRGGQETHECHEITTHSAEPASSGAAQPAVTA